MENINNSEKDIGEYELPKTQSESIFFLLSNIARLDDKHFDSLMAKLDEWRVGRRLSKKHNLND